jgi:HSP90 family molecular chaperone
LFEDNGIGVTEEVVVSYVDTIAADSGKEKVI